jgi:hypothetical protein
VQTLTELLAELRGHFPLVFSKCLSCETILRQVRFLLGTPFCGRLDCSLRPVSGFA